ncbi:MAG: hypothetical protein J6C82_03560 [Clostridia bacterium]|nr:hypothetical protein [Clostridia bacterium]
MGFYDDVMRAERRRTLDYAADIPDGDEVQCPVCGGYDWDFLLKDCHGDVIGCQECVTKLYWEDLCSDDGQDME